MVARESVQPDTGIWQRPCDQREREASAKRGGRVRWGLFGLSLLCFELLKRGGSHIVEGSVGVEVGRERVGTAGAYTRVAAGTVRIRDVVVGERVHAPLDAQPL